LHGASDWSRAYDLKNAGLELRDLERPLLKIMLTISNPCSWLLVGMAESYHHRDWNSSGSGGMRSGPCSLQSGVTE
jgi:hypothetical protein